MNIIVRPYGGDLCYCRPDTTWERENRDLYSPDCVDEWNWAPIIFARVSKAGKCISPKFVSRYYDAFNFGILLYIGKDVAFSSCADHTSVLPFPLYNTVVIENNENLLKIVRGAEEIFRTDCQRMKEIIEESICTASKLTSLRIGDFVAAELAPIASLCSRAEGEISLKGIFCDKDIFNFKVIY